MATFRKHLLTSIATLALAGTVACDKGSPTSVQPPEVREYVVETFALGPYRGRTIIVHYDTSWVGRIEQLRTLMQQGFEDGNDLIDDQIPPTNAVQNPNTSLSLDLYVEGDIEGLSFSTRPMGGYLPTGATCSEYEQGPASRIPDCVAHQMQHAFSRELGTPNYRQALHFVGGRTPLPSAYTIFGDTTNEPGITSRAVNNDVCDTD